MWLVRNISRKKCCRFLHYLQIFIYLTLLLNLGACMKIRPKLCTNALGEQGTCMFVWECIKTDGRHLGTCVDGFLFGSCCGHDEADNSIQHSSASSPITNELQHQTTSSMPIGTSTTISPSVVSSTIVKVTQKTTTTTTTTSTTTTTTTPAPSTTTTSTTTTPKPIVVSSSHYPYHHFSTPRPYTTSQRPWIIFTGRPPTTRRPTPTQPTPPAIIWPIINNIVNHQLSSASSSSSVYVPSTTVTTTTTTTTTTTPKPPQNEFTQQMESNRIPINNNQTSTESPNSHSNVTNTTTTPINNQQFTQSCGITQVKPRTKVVGGKNSAFGAWPWQVSVRRISFFGFSSTHRCGGALLNSQWIATAGHCVDDLLLTQIRIRVGEHDFSSSREPFPHIETGARKKIVHPKYNFFTYENDLALVQLDKPIDFRPHVSPICLPPDNIELLGRNATVTGWGRLSEGGVLPTVLQEVRVPIISNDKCKNMFLSAGRHEYIPDIFMCAGYDSGGRDSCQGDSGGPLQVQGDDGRWFLAGIISWGIGCGEPSLPGVCTRITKFKHWILSYISE